MFGKREVVQVIPLDELARFVKQVMSQSQAGTTITIYVNELHIHNGGEQSAYPLLNGGQVASPRLGDGRREEFPAELQRRGAQIVDMPSPWDYPPPSIRR